MARSVYNVIMKDMTRDHEYYWTKSIRKRIKEDLTDWFKTVCGYSKSYKSATVNCWWSSNALLVDEDELVVYFLPSPRHSLVKKVAGSLPIKDSGGATFQTKKGMISEVHISGAAGDARISRLLAILAFHELMHNKLDAHPSKSVHKDVHKLGGAAKGTLSASDSPSDSNKRLMGRHLGVEIKQYTGHLMSNAVGSVPG